jgi:hypothetical protein
MRPLEPGQDPRLVVPHHRERGLKRFGFTYADLARATGLALSTVRTWAHAFDSLEDLVEVVHQATSRRARPVAAEDLAGAVEASWWDAAKWAARWPRFGLWWCGRAGCREVRLEPGCCARHGGPRRPGVRFGAIGHFEVLLEGGYVPVHRLMVDVVPHMVVHHVDHNRWNNRPSNLQVMSMKEHMTHHAFGHELVLPSRG